MRFVQVFKNNQYLWTQISLVVSIGFVFLSAILLFLGNQLLEDSRRRVTEQRLVIAQLVANQIDRSLIAIIDDLLTTSHLADFDPSDPDLSAETDVMSAIYADSELPILELIFFDVDENVLLSYPSDQYTTRIDLPDPSNITNALNGKSALVSMPRWNTASEKLVTSISIPIFDGDRLLGWLSSVSDLNEPSIVSMLNDAVTQDKTAHAVLVDDQGRVIISTFDLPFLSPGEHFTYYRRAMAQGQPVVEEVPFELDLPDEPPGHHHIMAFVPLRVAPWGVSVGGDVIRETFAAPYQLFFWFATFIIVSLIAIWGVTIFSTRRLLEPAQNTNLKFNISRQIAGVKDWEELTSLIVRIPSIIMPVSDTRLLMPDGHNEVKLVSEWNSGGQTVPCLNLTKNAQVCQDCALARTDTTLSLISCVHEVEISSSENFNSFCFPLVHQNSLIGTLHFCIPSEASISDSQIEILTSMSTDMAIALENARFQQVALSQTEMTLAERKRIFRALHDTLGQNISYLHIKLDQYSNENSQFNIMEIQDDINKMRDIANQAYDQMRNMLVDLNPETQTDFLAALRSRADSVVERTNINIDFIVEGNPVNIPQAVKRHILFICYETLTNIERHAQAQNVLIKIQWRVDDTLKIMISNDGPGFDRHDISTEEHFGLSIMEDRARTINGKLILDSSAEGGTKITLQVPL